MSACEATIKNDGVCRDIEEATAVLKNLRYGSDHLQVEPGCVTQVEGDMEVPLVTVASATFEKPLDVDDLPVDRDIEFNVVPLAFATLETPLDVDDFGVLPSFTPEDLTLPWVRRSHKGPFPIPFTGHLPNIGSISPEEHQRLDSFYKNISGEDWEDYVLQKNMYRDNNKYYLKITDAKTLEPQTWLNDIIVNFIWLQFSEQYRRGHHDGLKVGLFPSFFFTKLLGEGGKTAGYNYMNVSKWSQPILGKGMSAMDYDILLFMRHDVDHWWMYVMFPKAKHIEGVDSMGYRDLAKTDIQYLWRWLNDDLHANSGWSKPLDTKGWVFNYGQKQGIPKQANGWDCGLYATHVGFAFALQAPLSEITPERIHTYRQKLLLYLLDGQPTRNILMPITCWYEDLQLESSLFEYECDRLYKFNVPPDLVDVLGDGHCLFYCFLSYLVEKKYFTNQWKKRDAPAVWMRRKIKKHASKLIKPEEWMTLCSQSDEAFVKGELERIYHPDIDYLHGDIMRESDECHGGIIDCLVFAKLYGMVVVMYYCNSNKNRCFTIILDGQPSASQSVQSFDGVHPEYGYAEAVLEVVNYSTDVEHQKYYKSGRKKRMVLGVEDGPTHYVFVRRHSRFMNEAAMTRADTRAQNQAQNEKGSSNPTGGAEGGRETAAGTPSSGDKEGEGDGDNNGPPGSPPGKGDGDKPSSNKKDNKKSEEEKKESDTESDDDDDDNSSQKKQHAF
jgi:hypothetical protein